MAYIDQEARWQVEQIIKHMIAGGQATMARLIEETQQFFHFDEEELRHHAIYRALRAKVKRERDENGIPDNVILRDHGGLIVNVPSCKDVELLKAAVEQNRDNVSRAMETMHKSERRLAEVEGQLSLFEQTET